MDNFVGYSSMLNILETMQECREGGHLNRARDCDKKHDLDEDMADALDTLFFPIDQQINRQIEELRYEAPTLPKDALNGTYKGQTISFYEKLRENALDDVFQQKDDLLALDAIFHAKEDLEDAVKHLSYNTAFKSYCEKAIITKIAINLLRFTSMRLSEIQDVLPMLTIADLYEIADDHKLRINLTEAETNQIVKDKEAGTWLNTDIREMLVKDTEESYPCILTLSLYEKEGWGYENTDEVKLYFKNQEACENWLYKNNFTLGQYEWLDVEPEDYWIHYNSTTREYISVDISEFEFDDEITKAPEWAR